jgi:hypothetical protein
MGEFSMTHPLALPFCGFWSLYKHTLYGIWHFYRVFGTLPFSVRPLLGHILGQVWPFMGHVCEFWAVSAICADFQMGCLENALSSL